MFDTAPGLEDRCVAARDYITTIPADRPSGATQTITSMRRAPRLDWSGGLVKRVWLAIDQQRDEYN
jgi:hypothetical protein